MQAPTIQASSFSQEWMAKGRLIKEVLPDAIQPYSATKPASDKELSSSSQLEISNAVTAGNESAQSKSSTEKSDTPKESEKDGENSEKQIAHTPEEKREISQLQIIDRTVRAHEQAHLNAAQDIAVSGANFEYRIGPDDKRYAVAGEVTIDTSREDEPEETIDKGYKIIRAALAPADPSPQDQSVAAYAQQMIYEAQAELMRESYTQNRDNGQKQNRPEGAGHEINLIV